MTTPFDAALNTVHQVSSRVDLLVPNEPRRTLKVSGGTVEMDASASIRRRLTGLTIADNTLIPTISSDPLSPLQNEIQVWRGLQYLDGTTELHSLGVFGIHETSVSDQGVPTITVSGFDRSAAVRDNRWTAPYAVASGTDYAVAIRALIADRFAGAQFVFPATVGVTSPNLLFGASSQNDPWRDAQQMAAACAHEVLVDADGRFVLRPIANPETQPSLWSFRDGVRANLVGVNRMLTRERSYTRVIAVSEGTALAAPLRSDVSVASTRPRPYFFRTGGVTTQAQLDTVANALLARLTGAFSTVNFQAIPDPRLDVGTVGTVQRARIGVVGKHILETLSIPLSADDGAMSGSVRGKNA